MFYPCLCLFLVSMAAYRITRRRVLRLTAVCTGLATGCLILMKEESASCRGQCRHLTSIAYQTLKKNELTFKVNHPLIRSVDVNFLPSNSPMEDRHAIGGIKDSCTGLFAVIDGHKSFHCSEFLRQSLLSHVAGTLRQGGAVKGPFGVYRDGDRMLEAGSPGSCELPSNHDDIPSLLRQSFVEMDKNISDGGLKGVELIKKGHSIKSNEGLFSNVMRSISGACALVAMLMPKMIYIASTGDCRAVLGRKAASEWEAMPLSRDQNAFNEEEVNRIKSAHPGEENTVIANKRLLGSLMPLRSFGDVEYKWPRESVEYINYVLAHYDTPPYLTAEPVITSHQVTEGDKFLILGTDGLWERMSNKDIVDIVGRHYSEQQDTDEAFSFWRRQEKKCCSEVNAATELLWESLGGSDRSVTNLLDLPSRISRVYRDDITIIVIHFK